MALSDSTIREALTKLGERLRVEHDVEILIVGGAAGILTGQLSGMLTTSDVDAVHFQLAKDRDVVLDMGAEVGQELGLPIDWLNDWGGLHQWTLPDDWRSGRVEIGLFNRLHVYAVGRADLISMKFIGHREHDLEHLLALNVTTAEKALVGKYLDTLFERYPEEKYPAEAGKIKMARRYLDEWEVES